MNNVPEIRFKGFEGVWERWKLGEMAKVNSGKDYKHLNVGDVPVYGTGGYMLSVDESLSEVDAIGIGRKGTIDKPQLLSAPFWTVDTLFFMTPEQNNDLLYLYVLSQTIEWAKMDESTGVPSLSKLNIQNVDVCVPKETEQAAIGNFFRTFDETLALCKRKLDGLKELKRGYLQQMFPQAGESVPRVRFKGFEGAWEQRKLGEIAERVVRKNKNLESTLPLTISAQYGLIDQNEFFDKQIASKDVSGYYLLKNGEFAYNKSYSNGYPWGAVKRLDRHESGVLSTLYIVFAPTGIESEFLVQYYETTNWHTEVSKRAAEGARNHGLLNIAPSDFFDTDLFIPTDVAEQTAIGAFFLNLDEQITAQQKKWDKLKQLKAAYLQKMFV